MPRGRYSLHDPHDHTPLGEEHFQCAPGPSGWRYVAQRTAPSGDHSGSVDLTLDELGRPLRVELHSASWQVRGAALDGVTWVRTDPTGAHATEGNVRAHSFTGASPAFLIAVSRLLRLEPGAGAVRVRLVAFTDPVLAPITLDQSWALLDRTGQRHRHRPARRGRVPGDRGGHRRGPDGSHRGGRGARRARYRAGGAGEPAVVLRGLTAISPALTCDV